MKATAFDKLWAPVLLAVFIFGLPGGVISQISRLTYDDLGQHGHFGKKLAVSGDFIIVAEPNYNSTEFTHVGRTHLFQRNGNTWSHAGLLDNAPVRPYNHFGQDIAMHGSELAISAPDLRTGSVFIYTREGENLSLSQQLTMPQEVYKEGLHVKFGERLKLNGEWLAISAPGYLGTADSILRTGAVFIFKKEGDTWTFHQLLLPPDLTKPTQFGSDIALSTTGLLISAPKGDGGDVNSGVVYHYTLQGSTWTQTYTFINPDSRSHELYGASIDSDGTTVMIGAPMHTVDPDVGPQGAVHVFWRLEDTWIRTAIITADDGKRNDMFGTRVMTSSGNFIVSAPRHDEPHKADVGKVYHYTINEYGYFTEKTSFLPLEEDQQSHMQFGSSIALHEHQLVVSGHLMNNSLEDSGIAYTIGLDLSTGHENQFPSSTLLNIYPNPVQSVMQIIPSDGWSDAIAIDLYTMDGRIVMHHELNHVASQSPQVLNVSALLPGTYFLHATDGAKVSIHKWIKL